MNEKELFSIDVFHGELGESQDDVIVDREELIKRYPYMEALLPAGPEEAFFFTLVSGWICTTIRRKR